MRFFLINFFVTFGAYGLISFVYPSEATMVPRICLVWTTPTVGTLAALFVTRVSFPGLALGAGALAMYSVSGVYCVVYHQQALVDTLPYVTTAYFLPGAFLALLVSIFAMFILTPKPKKQTVHNRFQL